MIIYLVIVSLINYTIFTTLIEFIKKTDEYYYYLDYQYIADISLLLIQQTTTKYGIYNTKLKASHLNTDCSVVS